MSILRKPYTIGVYEDVLVGDSFQEKRLGVIGSDKMTSLNRVLEPNLVRNVNGQYKFSFKMYKKYIDPVTGEEVQNLFVDWLCSERKVKLEYDNKWFDFIIKDINENSSNYLYTYQLEDANVQELAKNGFGVTLDTELMNNVGTAKELGQYVMEETDWTVEGDVIVQTIEESLIYLNFPISKSNLPIYKITDQGDDLSKGVTATLLTEDEKESLFFEKVNDEGQTIKVNNATILAFYSSCKNKPHRFQFIYSDKGYNKTANGYAIDRNDKRVITEKDCQYYIDFDDPNTAYSVHNTTYDLYLPANFNVVSMTGDDTTDTTISTWYRGTRYGYTQQAEYVPLLERYCQKFTKSKTFTINDIVKPFDHEDAISGDLTSASNSVTYNKQKEYAGVYFDVTYDNSEVYKLSYEVNNPSGTMYTLGGHAVSFEISQFDVKGFKEGKWEQVAVIPYHTPTLGVYNVPDGKRGHQKYKVTATYRKINKEGDGYPQIYIQPNIYESVDKNQTCIFTISNISFEIDQSYYGYTDTDYISPTLVQNYITNYDFKKTSGWTPTQTTKVTSDTKPTAESFYGRYVGGEFRSIVDDYLKGTYSDLNKYTSYLKMEFKQANQFVLNSGIRDNRTTICNMPVDEEWVLDYKIVDASNNDISDNFTYRLAEFIYDKESGGYSERTGSISVGSLTSTTAPSGAQFSRGIFKVITNNYTEDQFKGKNGSKGTYLNLQIKPKPADDENGGKTIPFECYLEHVALYRKVLDKNGDIIVPDYEAQESNAAQEYVDNSTLEHKYNYFNAWHVDGANPKKITDKEALPLYTTNTLNYITYKPVYNTGAQKVRSVSVKESNYFNILQSIAETFEQWLVIEINRDSSGAILPEYNQDGSIKNHGKKIKFKNYRGDNNYACFRYGVNLKDIQRTYSSKNIVTKLIVKQNANELGKDGFCTIQRAGANPTGENYIYDFQYLQNMGIMKADEYLTTNYYMTSAKGPDSALWKNNEVTNSTTFNLNGYFPRLKKINEAIIPLNQEIIGLNADLVKESAKKEVAEAEIEASLSGIEQTRLDFHALTGMYPEDAQDGTIGSVENINVTAQDNWYTAVLDTSSGTNSIKFTANRKDEQITPREILITQGTEKVSVSNGRYRVKSCGWDGLYVDYEYMHDKKYLLAYDLEIITPETDAPIFSNIGCHNTSFAADFKINIKGINNKVKADSTSHTCMLSGNITSGKYHVDVTGKFNTYADEHSKPCLYIQPNRGSDTKIEYVVSNIKLYEVDANSGEASYDRTVAAYVSAEITVQPSGGESSYEITRTFEVKGSLPAGYTDVTLPINITAVDLDRSDVKKYIEELTVYRQSNINATETLAAVGPVIAAKEQAIELKNQLRKQYLDWKKQLNYLFFKRYSQFIQEGTWINEEYVDDEKYYADAQSVLYNSCYPQVAYTINTLELSQLPGYELFKFDLGDKTWAIDDEFFGQGKREEVIITELSEMLDDPNRNQIKVQNFKNQFQDLFQKITATVQQTQYNVGSYEKGDALLNASAEKKSQFITDAINNAKSYLSAGQTVESGPSGITITDDSNKKRKLKLVGGAILFSTENPDTKETSWRTGLTNEGISADLITAGRLDAGAVQIMNGEDPVFRWDTYGISAYDARWQNTGGISTIDNINKNKFVRFDKHGIYGINNAAIDGSTWHPTGNGYEGNAGKEVDEKATFALTWEGLKVTGKSGIARIGRLKNEQNKEYIMSVQKQVKNESGQLEWKDTFRISAEGEVEVAGSLYIGELDGTAKVDTIIANAKTEAINTAAGDATNKANAAQAAAEATAAADASAKAAAAQAAAEATARGLAEGLQLQIDGAITSWFEEGAPGPQKNTDGTFTESTYPVTEWKEQETQINHEGDLYYDKDTGFCYRWVCDRVEGGEHGKHYWMLIKDTEVTKALNDAAKAQETADGKMTVYKEVPTSGMQEGDILIPDVDLTGGYKAGKVYRYKEDTQSWKPINYTDEATVITKIGEIQIGSRNILTGTSTGKGWGNAFIGNKEFKFVSPADASEGCQANAQRFDLEPNSQYTLSFKHRLAKDIVGEREDKPGSVEIYIFYDVTNESMTEDNVVWKINSAEYVPNSSDYTMFERTFTTGANVRDCVIRFDCNANANKTKSAWYVKEIKLEKGNKATDWTVAPEDLDNAIDAVKTQADAKADIYYQPLDPAVYSGNNVWGSVRVGDMWRCTNTATNYHSTINTAATTTTILRKKNAEYIWTDDNTNGYGWHEMEIPNNIFDAYDGKASLYVSKPENGYKARDLWILDRQGRNSSDTTTYDKTYPPYDVGTLLISTTDRPNASDANTKYNKDDWVEQVKYTRELDAFKQSWGQDKLTLEDAINGRIKTSDLSVSKSIDPDTGLAVTTITLNGATTKTYTSEDGAYLLTNVGVGKKEDGSSSYFMVDADGALQADNAIINGTIFANAGKIAGWEISQTKGANDKYTGSLTYGTIGTANSFHMYGNDYGVRGTVSNKTISGTLGSNNPGWKLTVGDNFGVTADGTLYANKVVLGNNVSWSESSSPTQVAYNRTAATKLSNGTKHSSLPKGYDSSKYNGWHKTFDAANDKYASYTYDGGNTWGGAIQIVGQQGNQGHSIRQVTRTLSTSYKYETVMGYVGSTNDWWSNITIDEYQIGDTCFIPCVISDRNNEVGYMVCTIRDYDSSRQRICVDNLYFQMGPTGPQGEGVTVKNIEYAAGSSPTSAPTSGWITNISQVPLNGTNPYLWSKTTYSDGSFATICAKNYVTRNDLWGTLDPNDGIYEDKTAGELKIRATAIVSGALQVGGTAGDPESDGTLFYAGLDNPSVEIGGWSVSDHGLRSSIEGKISGLLKMNRSYFSTDADGQDQFSYELLNNNTYMINGYADGYTPEESILSIPPVIKEQDGALKKVTKINSNAFKDNKSLIEVIIPDTVQYIGDNAFSNNDNLEKILLGSSVQEIGNGFASGCTKLTEINLPLNLTKIGEEAFAGCSKLVRLTIPEKVTTIGKKAFTTDMILICEVPAKPDGWDQEWYTGSSSLVYGPIFSSFPLIASLIDSNKTAQPVFFAGSYLNFPFRRTDAPFIVLDDGSLYAKAVMIGSFDSSDIGKEGNFSISSGENGILGTLAGKEDYWRIAIGENFGVTNSGSVYAKAGQIGPLGISADGIGVDGTGSTSGNTYLTSTKVTSSIGKFHSLAIGNLRYLMDYQGYGDKFYIGTHYLSFRISDSDPEYDKFIVFDNSGIHRYTVQITGGDSQVKQTLLSFN